MLINNHYEAELEKGKQNVTCNVRVAFETLERFFSCSFKNSKKPRRVPINDVATARSEKASNIYETPLHLSLVQGPCIIDIN